MINSTHNVFNVEIILCFERIMLGAVYMGAGTGRLPGRDVTRDPGMYMFL